MSLLSDNAYENGMDFSAVSWEDCTRGWCKYSNISDVRIKDSKKRPVYTLRYRDYNEKLSQVNASDVSLIVDDKLTTLSDYLKNAYLSIADETVSLRFQAVFVHEDSEITPNVYSYANDPQDMLIYCTSQGSFLSQEVSKSSDLFAHMFNPCWTKTCSSQEAIKHIGVPSMKKRFDCVMVIQIPLAQKQRTLRRSLAYGSHDLANAIARNEEKDICSKVIIEKPTRNPDQRITVTITIYYVVKDGIPDIEKAITLIDDLHNSSLSSYRTAALIN